MKTFKIFCLFAVFIVMLGCNNSRDIPLPVEQVRPTFMNFTNPQDSAFAFDRQAPIRMHFSEPMDPATFPGNFFLWEDEEHTSFVKGSFTADGNDILFQPAQDLLKAHEYFVELRARVKDVNGNGIDKDPLLVATSEFITDGDYSQYGVPEVIVSNGSDDFLARITSKDSRLKADTAATIDGFGRYLEMAFTTDGQWLVMSDYNSSNSGIYFFDPVNYQIVKKLDTNSDGTEVKKSAEIAVTSDKLYVANQSSKKISVVDLGSQEITGVIDLPNTPKGMAVLPDGSKLYVGSGRDNSVWIIDTQTNTISKTITINDITRCFRLAAAARGKFVAVREFSGNHLSFIDAASETVVNTIDLGYPGKSGNNNDLAAYGDYLYASSSGGELTKIDVNTQTVERQITDINFQGLDIYSTGEFLFAIVRKTVSEVAVIRSEDLKIVRRIRINGAAPWDVAIRP